jgi:nitrate/nitrite transport system substrate-binding protein
MSTLAATPTLTARPAAAGHGRPERDSVRIGFLPLTDCASVVMASVLGFDRQHGVRIVLDKAASWARVRDRLAGDDLDLAHLPYGVAYGVHLGLGGPQRDMAVLMTLNQNGQAITLSRRLADRGVGDAATLAQAMAREARRFTFAQTFPTSTHALWLYYWLAAGGIHPLRDARVVSVPPPQMGASMRAGQIDAFCAGEPWNHRAVIDGVGITAATSQSIWPDHPEKALACTAAFAHRHPNTCRAVLMAVLEASRWIEAKAEHRQRTAEALAALDPLRLQGEATLPRLLGLYDDGAGRRWQDPHPLRFFGDGAVTFPWLSDGLWFLTQFRRWGLLDAWPAAHPDYAAIVHAVQRIDLYRDAAAALGIAVPGETHRASRLFDGRLWDGSDPATYADTFEIGAAAPDAAAA